MIEQCPFESILPIWRDQLWPGRKSAIEAHSAMRWLGGIDMSLMSSAVSFWQSRLATTSQATLDNSRSLNPIAVLSGHFGGVIDASQFGLSSKEKSYRTRGLWVSSAARRQGVARALMEAAFEQARREECSVVWTFPRESSLPFYNSLGFTQVGAMIGVDDPGAGEFGPNCYAIAKI